MWQAIKNYYHLLQSLIASIIYGFPAKKLKVIGVTGTDGKTTTAHMIYQILTAAGFKVGLISSLGAKFDKKIEDTGFHITTPSPFQLQGLLAKMLAKSCQLVVLEVTSHGLDQNRVAFIPFEVGVLTNITPEHLDYHQTFKNYLQAKGKLFKIAKTSVLNSDDKSFPHFKKFANGKVVTYGIKVASAISLKKFPLQLKIVGEYNYYNALAAVAVSGVLGIKDEIVKSSLENFSGLPGRMEELDTGQDFRIIIDFAHTPNALEQALETLRSHLKPKTSNLKPKIISVFGCAGERDKLKRPLMGEISAKLATITIITSEDPRSEDPGQIAEQILVGCQKVGGILGKNVFIEIDRKKAIKLAIKLAKPGDLVVIFGKGHEKTMAYDGKEFPWSDQKAVEIALKELNET